MNTYTTKQGDMWDSVSKKIYGSEKYAIDIMQANPTHMPTLVFPAGIVLTVPDVEAASSSADLPPWRT